MNIIEKIFDILIGTVAAFIVFSLVFVLFDVCLKAITNYSILQNIVHPFFRSLFQ